jgi:hypothetical protein
MGPALKVGCRNQYELEKVRTENSRNTTQFLTAKSDVECRENFITANWDQLLEEAESPARASFPLPGGHSFRLTVTLCRPNLRTAECTLSNRMPRPTPLGCHSSACPACSRHLAWREVPTTIERAMPIRCWPEQRSRSKRLEDRSLRLMDIPGRVRWLQALYDWRLHLDR